MSTIAPERSLQQRLSALEIANDARLWRAKVKRDMKAERLLLVDVLWSEDARLETMRLRELLLAVPHVGAVKIDPLLSRLRISPSKRIGSLTERQLTALIRELERSTPAVRKHALGY